MPEETLRATAPSDAELITAVRTGDSRAYEELYRRHAQAAMAVGRHLTGSKSDAEDVVSEAFTRVLSALQRGAGPEMAFRPYLLTSVRNAFYDRTRKDKRVDVTGEVPEDLGMVLADAARSEEGTERAMAAAAFASLPERWQLVLWHTEVEGMSPAEVGPLLGLAPNAVAALAYRAREGLRQAYLNAHIQTALPEQCAEIVPKLGAYVRNDLSNRDRRKVDEHLEHCDRCPAILAELEEAGSRLRVALIPIIAGIPVAAYLGGIGTGVVGGLAAWGSRVGQRFGQLSPVGQAATVVGAALVAGALAVGTVAVATNAGGGKGGDRAAVTTDGSGSSGGTRSGSGGAGSGGAGSGGAAGGGAGPVASTPSSSPAATATSTTNPLANPSGAAGSPGGGTNTGVSPTGTTISPGGGAVTPSAPGGGTVATTPTVPTTPGGPASPPTSPSSGPTTTVPASGLTVSLTSPGPVYAGGPAGLSVAVANGSAPAATRAVAQAVPIDRARSFAPEATFAAAAPTGPLTFTLPLPTGTSFASIDNGSWSCAVASAVLRCELPAPSAGGSSVGVLQIAVATNAPHMITLQASVALGTLPPIVGAPLTITVRPPPSGISEVFVDKADLALLGNAVLTCDPISVLLRCPTARDDPSAVGVQADKQLQAMTYVDVDGDAATFDSSSATLALPPGAEILRARLVWGGALEGGLLGRPAPSPGDDGTVRLDPPRTAPVAVPASRVSPDPSVAFHYVASADVTAIVARGGAGTYTVADVQTGTGRNMFGGWALQVVFRDPAAPLRLIGLADQVVTLNRGASAKVELDGLAPSTAARPAAASFAAFEGDFSRRPERILLNGATLSNAGNASNDPLNGSITTPGVRNPAFVNNFGFDADRFATVIAPGDTEADMTITTVNDRARMAAFGLAVTL